MMMPIRLVIRTKLLLLAGIPVLGSLILAGLVAQHARTQTAAAASLGSIEDVASLSVRISELVGALQNERAHAAMLEGNQLGELTGLRQPMTGEASSELARQTTAAWRRLDQFLSARDLSKLPARLAHDIRAPQRSSSSARVCSNARTTRQSRSKRFSRYTAARPMLC